MAPTRSGLINRLLNKFFTKLFLLRLIYAAARAATNRVYLERPEWVESGRLSDAAPPKADIRECSRMPEETNCKAGHVVQRVGHPSSDESMPKRVLAPGYEGTRENKKTPCHTEKPQKREQAVQTGP